MSSPSRKGPPEVKERLHPRNRHRARYNFAELTVKHPELAPFVTTSIHGLTSINFFDPEAVKVLNQVLLRTHYDITHWDIPPHYLCPPIPGRADYMHYMADLLAEGNGDAIPTGKAIRVLDIGVGANCIYPIVGIKEYGWSYVGADIDPVALKVAGAIVSANALLKGRVELRSQLMGNRVFHGMMRHEERFDLTICNPPFHASYAEAEAKSLRKYNSLTRKQHDKPVLNFGGQSNELWCEGGEPAFVSRMVRESMDFSKNVRWFTSLISKQASLKTVYAAIEKAKAVEVRTIPMGQGSKTSRVVAWTFLNAEEAEQWAKDRWKGGK